MVQFLRQVAAYADLDLSDPYNAHFRTQGPPCTIRATCDRAL